MLKLMDTLSQELKPVLAHSDSTLKMYVCGITPYDDTHLGHARTFCAIDILRRYLEYKKVKVFHIQNVTDIDDKIINRAKEKGLLPLELSSYYDKKSRIELEKLNVLKPHSMPKVSENIKQIEEMIDKILKNGYGYIVKSGIYFEVSKYKKYGQLSKQDLEKMKAGARIEPKEDKKDHLDFALWKFEQEKGATFQTKWGKGRPGWHIECSAMSLNEAKANSLDLHAGARDLIFPHHENEIAQAEAAGYVPFCHHWVHTGFLTVQGQKMSKSLGNFITLEQALQKWEVNVLRLFFALSHYSSPLDFQESVINGLQLTYKNIQNSLFVMEQPFIKIQPNQQKQQQLIQYIESKIKEFENYMDNDLNSPQALASLIEATKEIENAKKQGNVDYALIDNQAQKLKQLFSIFGLEIENPKLKISMQEIKGLILEREKARKEKDFKKADQIRSSLKEKGILIEDSPIGQYIQIE